MTEEIQVQSGGFGRYPKNWKQISDKVCADAGGCVRCGHPYTKKAHGNGQWSPCNERCKHDGPIRIVDGKKEAEWRILTVHHLNGLKHDCEWFNIIPLCQRCHLQIQGRVDPEQPWFLEHSAWFKIYAAGYYARKYEGKNLKRKEVMERLDELLAYERRC